MSLRQNFGNQYLFKRLVKDGIQSKCRHAMWDNCGWLFMCSWTENENEKKGFQFYKPCRLFYKTKNALLSTTFFLFSVKGFNQSLKHIFVHSSAKHLSPLRTKDKISFWSPLSCDTRDEIRTVIDRLSEGWSRARVQVQRRWQKSRQQPKLTLSVQQPSEEELPRQGL